MPFARPERGVRVARVCAERTIRAHRTRGKNPGCEGRKRRKQRSAGVRRGNLVRNGVCGGCCDVAERERASLALSGSQGAEVWSLRTITCAPELVGSLAFREPGKAWQLNCIGGTARVPQIASSCFVLVVHCLERSSCLICYAYCRTWRGTKRLCRLRLIKPNAFCNRLPMLISPPDARESQNVPCFRTTRPNPCMLCPPEKLAANSTESKLTTHASTQANHAQQKVMKISAAKPKA